MVQILRKVELLQPEQVPPVLRSLTEAAHQIRLQHLGHRERGITDYHYAGSDHVLNREIDTAILEQSVSG